MTSFMQKKETVDRKWYVIDAKDQPLGKVAAKAAHMLRGKHKPTYTPHIECGDYIIIINAKEVKLTEISIMDRQSNGSFIVKDRVMDTHKCVSIVSQHDDLNKSSNDEVLEEKKIVSLNIEDRTLKKIDDKAGQNP